MSFGAWLAAAQKSALAAAIEHSLLLTAGLSALHLIGFSVLMGAVLISHLRLADLALTERPVSDVTRPTAAGVAVGLAISVVTGILLFLPRAPRAAANGLFQMKMGFLAAAAFVYVAAFRRAARSSSAGVRRTAGLGGLVLWWGVALSACAYILLE